MTTTSIARTAVPADRRTARIVGILFILASVAAVAGGTLLLPTQGDDFLTAAADDSGLVLLGAALEIIQAVAVVGIAVLLFPILKRQHEGMALGFVGARTLEGVFTLVGTVFALQVLSLSQDLAGDSSAGTIGGILIAGRDWAYLVGPMIMFSISAIILYALLLRGRLVPTWLSLWGLIGGLLLLASAVIELMGTDLGAAQALFSAPIGVNEMVLAVWLIVKGFNVARGDEATQEPVQRAQ